MTTAYSPLLGLALPVTGELSGTWGDTVNVSITSLLDSAVAGTTTLSTDADVTLTTTTGAANTAREAILLFSGARTALRTITAPAASKIYTVINATTGGFGVKLVGAGPTTGLTIPAGASAVVAWNGSDFVEIGSTTLNSLTVTGNLTVNGTSTLTGAITNTAGTANGVAYLNGSKVLTTGSALWFDGTNFGVGTGGNSLNHQSVVYKVGANAVYQQIANGSTGLAATNGVRLGVSAGGTGELYSPTALISYIDNSEQMRLTSTGLGIGTSSPSAPLSFANATGQKIRFYNALSGYGIGVENSEFRFVTDNSAVFTWGVGTYASSSEQMRLTSTGLGIGTSSPSTKLTVESTASDTTVRVYSALSGSLFYSGYQVARAGVTGGASMRAARNASIGGVGWEWLTTADNGAELSGTYTSRMVLDASGNLGLGVTPSAWSGVSNVFQLKGNAYVASTTHVLNHTANAFFNGTNWIYTSSNFASQTEQVSGQHRWFNAPSGTAGNAITFTQAMTLDASGNLGIGTSSPSFALDISQVAPRIRQTATTGANSSLLQLVNTGGTAYIGLDNSSGGLSTAYALNVFHSGAYPIVFSTSGTERARIDSSGNLLVGTTTVGTWTSNSWGVQTSAGFTVTGHANGTSSGTAFAYFDYNNSPIGSITQSGTTAVLYNVTSDQRLKENIVNAPEFGSVIDAIQVRSYDWKTDRTHQRAGFVAQELVTVAPEAVHQPEDPEAMMAVDYSKLVPMLVKEIQSLRKRLAAAGL